eukprot:s1385_g43.t2
MHCEMCENRMVLRAHGRARRVCGCRPLHVGLCLPFAAAATLLLAWQQETFFRANSEIGWGAPSTSFQNAVRFLPKEEPAAEPQAPEPEAADPAPQLDTEETQDRIAKPAEVDDEEEEEEAEATSVEVKAPILPKKHQMPQPKTLLGVYEELCRMGIQSPGGIRNAGAEVRDAVVKLYQNLVERPPPAPFHRERMVHLASPNCRDPMWRHLLDGSRRKTPRIVVDVTTGMGGGPELDLLEMRLWEINASLSHLDGSPPVKALHRRFRCVRMAEQQDWLGKFDNATSFLYTAHNANGTPTRRLGYENSDGPLPVERTARHLLTMCDLSREEVMNILRVATAMKESRRTFMDTGFDRFSEILKGCSLLTLFEKPSLRTRVSLEVGMNQMGGQAIFYSIADSPLGAKESIQDTGRVLSRMCQGITARVTSRKGLRSLAQVQSLAWCNLMMLCNGSIGKRCAKQRGSNSIDSNAMSGSVSQEYCRSAFMISKLSLFEGIDMDTALESQEQQLEWHAAYREYVSLMEERVLAACAEAPNVTKEACTIGRQQVPRYMAMATCMDPAVRAQRANVHDVCVVARREKCGYLVLLNKGALGKEFKLPAGKFEHPGIGGDSYYEAASDAASCKMLVQTGMVVAPSRFKRIRFAGQVQEKIGNRLFYEVWISDQDSVEKGVRRTELARSYRLLRFYFSPRYSPCCHSLAGHQPTMAYALLAVQAIYQYPETCCLGGVIMKMGEMFCQICGWLSMFEYGSCLVASIACADELRRQSLSSGPKADAPPGVSSIPVINALDDYAHPMQMCADLLTIFEHKGSINGLTMAYMGDLENNVTYDLMRTAALMGYNLNLACPSASGLSNVSKVWTEVNALTEKSGSKVTVFPTAKEAISGVDVVYCDSWMSYGIPKDEEEARKKLFMPFQVTTELMKLAKPDAIFMNCLPAARGMEQTAEVIDGPQSVVFDQAENRLHAQKALLVFLIAPKRFMETLGAPLHPGRP